MEEKILFQLNHIESDKDLNSPVMMSVVVVVTVVVILFVFVIVMMLMAVSVEQKRRF